MRHDRSALHQSTQWWDGHRTVGRIGAEGVICHPCKAADYAIANLPYEFSEILERAKGIEPSYAAWEAAVLPLNYARERRFGHRRWLFPSYSGMWPSISSARQSSARLAVSVTSVQLSGRYVFSPPVLRSLSRLRRAKILFATAPGASYNAAMVQPLRKRINEDECLFKHQRNNVAWRNACHRRRLTPHMMTGVLR
jgi:hypothetical protein